MAAKGLKVAGFSVTCREAARVARKGVRRTVVSGKRRMARRETNRSEQIFGEAGGGENMAKGSTGLARE